MADGVDLQQLNVDMLPQTPPDDHRHWPDEDGHAETYADILRSLLIRCQLDEHSVEVTGEDVSCSICLDQIDEPFAMKHCGSWFCMDCATKLVECSPNWKASCVVCHQDLVELRHVHLTMTTDKNARTQAASAVSVNSRRNGIVLDMSFHGPSDRAACDVAIADARQRVVPIRSMWGVVTYLTAALLFFGLAIVNGIRADTAADFLFVGLPAMICSTIFALMTVYEVERYWSHEMSSIFVTVGWVPERLIAIKHKLGVMINVWVAVMCAAVITVLCFAAYVFSTNGNVGLNDAGMIISATSAVLIAACALVAATGSVYAGNRAVSDRGMFGFCMLMFMATLVFVVIIIETKP